MDLIGNATAVIVCLLEGHYFVAGGAPVDYIDTPVKTALSDIVKGKCVVVREGNDYKGMLQSSEVDPEDIANNRTVGQMHLTPIHLKHKNTSMGDISSIVSGNAVVGVTGEDNLINGIVTLSDYAKHKR
jgi:hypothetical protein